MSLCPVCLRRISAVRETVGEDVFLRKTCPDHGEFRSVVWRGDPAIDAWQRSKIPTTPRHLHRGVERECPFDCGLCPAHRQRSCVILFEVTQRCDLGCPICFARAGRSDQPDPSLSTLEGWFHDAAMASGDALIQLSGGEPTLRDDLPEVVRLARKAGFPFIQINTNGLRLAREESYVRNLRRAGLDTIFLQFDGTSDDVYRAIRGRALLAEKLAAIEACGRHDLGVVLVPTVVPGINTHDVGAIIRLALDRVPVVRAVHFQPASYFGRYPQAPQDRDRVTLPELIQVIKAQTDGLFPAEAFVPPGCENALCSFHGRFLIDRDGRIRSLGAEAQSCCSAPPQPADEGALRTMSRIARDWAAPLAPTGETKLPAVEARGRAEVPDRRSTPPMAGTAPVGTFISLDDFILAARSRSFSVSAMAFQDAWTLDLQRLRDCCIHVYSPTGDLIPFCAYYLTSVDGRGLYR